MYKGSRRRRSFQIACIICFVLIVLVLGILLWIGNYFYNYALNPNSTGGFSAPTDIIDTADTRWLLESGVSQDVYLDSRDGLKLHAYQIAQPEGHKYAVLCHGYQSNAANTASYGRHFYELGYTVYLPDARGHGGSEGDYIGMGWPERLDILDWIDAIVSSDPQAEIALFGISMGGATVMIVSGEPLPPNVKCIVEDCGYSTVWDEFAGQLKELFNLPAFPILNVTSLVTKVRAGYFLGDVTPVEQVANSVTPMLFIHGEEDAFVPYWMLDVVYDAASCEKEKLSVPNAAHAESAAVAPDLYWGTVDTFLNNYIA